METNEAEEFKEKIFKSLTCLKQEDMGENKTRIEIEELGAARQLQGWDYGRGM